MKKSARLNVAFVKLLAALLALALAAQGTAEAAAVMPELRTPIDRGLAPRPASLSWEILKPIFENAHPDFKSKLFPTGITLEDYSQIMEIVQARIELLLEDISIERDITLVEEKIKELQFIRYRCADPELVAQIDTGLGQISSKRKEIESFMIATAQTFDTNYAPGIHAYGVPVAILGQVIDSANTREARIAALEEMRTMVTPTHGGRNAQRVYAGKLSHALSGDSPDVGCRHRQVILQEHVTPIIPRLEQDEQLDLAHGIVTSLGLPDSPPDYLRKGLDALEKLYWCAHRTVRSVILHELLLEAISGQSSLNRHFRTDTFGKVTGWIERWQDPELAANALALLKAAARIPGQENVMQEWIVRVSRRAGAGFARLRPLPAIDIGSPRLRGILGLLKSQVRSNPRIAFFPAATAVFYVTSELTLGYHGWSGIAAMAAAVIAGEYTRTMVHSYRRPGVAVAGGLMVSALTIALASLPAVGLLGAAIFAAVSPFIFADFIAAGGIASGSLAFLPFVGAVIAVITMWVRSK